MCTYRINCTKYCLNFFLTFIQINVRHTLFFIMSKYYNYKIKTHIDFFLNLLHGLQVCQAQAIFPYRIFVHKQEVQKYVKRLQNKSYGITCLQSYLVLTVTCSHRQLNFYVKSIVRCLHWQQMVKLMPIKQITNVLNSLSF